MAIRTGAEYKARLHNTPREVWINGERVTDVTQHPSLRLPIEQIANLYDMQHDPEYSDALVRPGPNGPVGTAFVPPRSYQDLVDRRKAFTLWSEATLGLMGRSPDFMNTTLMAFADEPSVFHRLGQRFADNVQRYFEYVRDNDLFMTHALITPQTDRSKSSAEQEEEFLHMGVVRETPEGLVVRGARMLATFAPMADEMVIYNLPSLRAGDEKHAAVFAIPIETPGLRLITREPYDDGGRNDSIIRCPPASTRRTRWWCSTMSSYRGTESSSTAMCRWPMRCTSKPASVSTPVIRPACAGWSRCSSRSASR
nr:4-hydroxyphenylacetate 3-hydroxylase N-terminal domain-containing protein [Rhodococcus opacus]